MKTLVILQARTSSSRLLGKVLKPILGEPMLYRQIQRVRQAFPSENIIVATSTESSDDAVAKMCEEKDINCFRGSLNDVLDRFYRAAKPLDPDTVVRLTGDCPLFDPEVAQSLVKMHYEANVDYTSNVTPPTFPHGLDIEAVRFESLEKAWKESSLASDREHVTAYIRRQPDLFSHANYSNETDLTHLRWTVDEPEDFELIKWIYEKLYPQKQFFNTQDILELYAKEPDMFAINNKFHRDDNWRPPENM